MGRPDPEYPQLGSSGRRASRHGGPISDRGSWTFVHTQDLLP